ncbi:UDP-N-acetylglucosamine 2-epimerase [Azospirillum halopraeferens]|uniref:UDP-N-acetylglucosamine 2-epimerase n=1 Tax=Azospirillum halopraeferens TaxID=34010 RepID=UPI000427DC1A|nr:UDP-N-acetylglucosamine 2-epimerase [Azospirillum halopraeferens]
MSPPVRLCAVSGSRADFGLYRWVLHELHEDPRFAVEVAVTGMHLSPEFGMTVRDVEASGIPVAARVETLLSSDSGVGVAKAVGLGVLGFAESWQRHRPDLVMVLGDRFEMFAAAQTAFLMRIPIVHLCGGDVTEGAFDDAMRHAISKMAAVHFTTNAEAGARLVRMGEPPERVFTVGSPGLDHLHRTPRLDRAALEEALGFALRPRNLLVTFHPVTLDRVSSARQMEALLDALDRLSPEVGLIITLPNADTEGRALIAQIEAFTVGRANAIARPSLGSRTYLSALALVDAVVGNSSSGLYEAPSFGTPTVNIGDRQKGRLKATSVIDCPADRDAIAAAIGEALARGRRPTENPYGDGHTARRIRTILGDLIDRGADSAHLIRKGLHDG